MHFILSLLAWMQQRADISDGWSDYRTVMVTLTGAGVSWLVVLMWGVRDRTRKLTDTVGSASERGTLVQRMYDLEDTVDGIILRNERIDAVVKQHNRDMERAPSGGQRASDVFLNQLVHAVDTSAHDTKTRQRDRER